MKVSSDVDKIRPSNVNSAGTAYQGQGGRLMTAPQSSDEALRAMADQLGFRFSDEELEALSPQVRRSAEALASLDVTDAEPAIIFRADTE